MAVNGALILDPTGLPRRRVPGTPGPAAGSRGGHLPPRTPQAEGGRGEASPDRQGLCWTVRLSLRALVRESCWVSNRRRLSGWTEPASEAASFPAGIPPAALWQVGQWLGPLTAASPGLSVWLGQGHAQQRPFMRNAHSELSRPRAGRGPFCLRSRAQCSWKVLFYLYTL